MDNDELDCSSEFYKPQQPSTSVPMYSDDIVTEAVTDVVSELGAKTADLLKKLEKKQQREFFDVDGCIEWIRSKNFGRVALQFPDYLLSYASQISSWLEKETGAKIFILADTSYRSCCVDDVAAEHANPDCIIHYGEACLSTYSGRYPVRYVFGSYTFNTNIFTEFINANRTKLTAYSILLYDVAYTDFIKENFESLVTSAIPNVMNAIPSTMDTTATVAGSKLSLGRRIPENFAEFSDVTVVFIGNEDSPLLTLWLMTHINCTNVLSYNPCSGSCRSFPSNSLRQLKKRLFLVEKLKDAATVGAAVCSLGTSGYEDAVKRLALLCEKANKKFYVVSVGKLNVAKLSNFATDIDVFVIISCPFGIILDSTDFYCPVVSFFEAESALNPDKTWSALTEWTTDYRSIAKEPLGDGAADEVDLSLVSGKIRALRTSDASSSVSNQISLYNAGGYFGDKTWKGLDDTRTGEEGTEMYEGRKGIASHYESEIS